MLEQIGSTTEFHESHNWFLGLWSPRFMSKGMDYLEAVGPKKSGILPQSSSTVFTDTFYELKGSRDYGREGSFL